MEWHEVFRFLVYVFFGTFFAVAGIGLAVIVVANVARLLGMPV